MEKNELYGTFVAREDLLSELLETINDNTGKKSIQHIILLGARGIGKTNMLRMVENKVHDSSQLQSKWITVNVPEEQYGIFGLLDFFKYILEIILHSSQTEKIDKDEYKKELEKVDSSRNKESLDKLISIFKDISHKENKQFLLLIDNIDKILAEKITDEKELEYLRSILMTDNFLMILGTSTSIFEEIALYDKAFFRFFKTIHLQNLNDKEVEALLLKRAKFDGIVDKIKLNENKNKIKAIADLTGGYPRLVLMLYEILEDKPLLDVLKTFNKLLDTLTPYYKHRMDDLTPQQQKIIDTIMLSDGVASPTEVAKNIRWKPTVITSQFTRLKDINILKIKEDGKPKKRKSLYEVSDKLFVIWYQMRYLGVLRRQIEYIVTFLKVWYDLEELRDKISLYALQYRKNYSAGDFYSSYSYARSISIMSNAITDASEKEKICLEQINRYISIGKFQDALDEQKELLKIDIEVDNRKGVARDYSNIGRIYYIQGELKNALEHYEKALKIFEEMGSRENIADQLSNMGFIYSIQNDLQKAMEYFEKALKIDQDIGDNVGIANQLGNIGNIYFKQDNPQKALMHHEKALKIDEEIGNNEGTSSDYGNIGIIYGMQGDAQKAVECFEKSHKISEEIGDKEGLGNYYGNMGNVYSIQGDLQRALEYLEKALKIFKDVGNNLKYNICINNKLNILLRLSITNNEAKNIGKALENIEEIVRLLKETKNEE